MKLEKKKLILLLSFIIIPFILIYKMVFFDLYFDSNTDSFVTLLDWKWSIIVDWNIINLWIWNKKKIQEWYIIKSIWENSIIWLTWWDWSITRLWWDTELNIINSHFSNDLNKINVDLELVKWRAWANVKSLLWSKSYFKITWKNTVAGVRWTIFTMDINNNFIDILDHKVNLYNKYEWIIDGYWWETFSLDNLSRISLHDFLQLSVNKDLDKLLLNWKKLNEEYDKVYFKNLYLDISTEASTYNPLLQLMEVFFPKYRAIYEIDHFTNYDSLKYSIIWLKNDDLSFVYKYLLYKYQDLNFIWPDDNLFEKKIAFRNILTLISWEKDKAIFVKSSIYDLNESVKSNNEEALSVISKYIVENKDLLLESDLNAILKDNLSSVLLDDWIKQVLLENFKSLKDLIDINNYNPDELLDKAKSLKVWLDNIVNNLLEDTLWDFNK